MAERRAAAPRSPSRPVEAAMYIRAVMCRCAIYTSCFSLLLDLDPASEIIVEYGHQNTVS